MDLELQKSTVSSVESVNYKKIIDFCIILNTYTKIANYSSEQQILNENEPCYVYCSIQ